MGGLRIAVLGTRGFPDVQGGVERHCEELYPRLSSLGCRVMVYSRKGYVDSGRKRYKGVDMFPMWAPRIKSMEAIIHTLLGIIHISFHRKAFDIVHIHAIGPSLLTPVARLLGFKVVVTNHGPDYDRQKWGRMAKRVLRFSEAVGVRFASAVIAVSKHIKRSLKEKHSRESSYIPNGVILPEKMPPGSTIARYSLKEGRYIFAVGRLVPEKGFHDLLEVFKNISTDWKLVIAGGVDHKDNYSASLYKHAEADDRVVMTGAISGDTLSELYSNAGFFILPSYHEGLPITLLEAMSYGLPLLASNIPANMELVVDESFTFPPGDRKLMADMISQIINKSPGKKRIAMNKERLDKEFNWDEITGETMSVYLALCER